MMVFDGRVFSRTTGTSAKASVVENRLQHAPPADILLARTIEESNEEEEEARQRRKRS